LVVKSHCSETMLRPLKRIPDNPNLFHNQSHQARMP
jgi:hypothetical protein